MKGLTLRAPSLEVDDRDFFLFAFSSDLLDAEPSDLLLSWKADDVIRLMKQGILHNNQTWLKIAPLKPNQIINDFSEHRSYGQRALWLKASTVLVKSGLEPELQVQKMTIMSLKEPPASLFLRDTPMIRILAGRGPFEIITYEQPIASEEQEGVHS